MYVYEENEKKLEKYEINLERLKNTKPVDLAQVKIKKIKKINYKKIKNKINEMESFLYKNYIKDYEIAFEQELEKIKQIEIKKKKIFEETKKRAEEFATMLLGILDDATEKEKKYILSEKYRKEMDLDTRNLNSSKVYRWLRKMKKNPEFGPENSEKIRNWLINHTKIFGKEFEERYDPFIIIIKIANIK